MSQYHTPVLLEESVGLLAVEPAGTYADLTFGGGGHSRRILSDLGPEGRLYGFDQDRDTLENRPDDARFHYVESNFRFLRGALRLRGVTEVDGILAIHWYNWNEHKFDTNYPFFLPAQPGFEAVTREITANGDFVVPYLNGHLWDSTLPSYATDGTAAATAITMVFLGALLTCLHLYDELAKHAGAGTIVPISGFANAIVSPAIEYKSEGLILGLGAKLFVIAGPVLVYGITASVLYGLVLLVLKGGGAG